MDSPSSQKDDAIEAKEMTFYGTNFTMQTPISHGAYWPACYGMGGWAYPVYGYPAYANYPCLAIPTFPSHHGGDGDERTASSAFSTYRAKQASQSKRREEGLLTFKKRSTTAIQNKASQSSLPPLETEEDIEKWREERRKRYPTAARVLEKVAEHPTTIPLNVATNMEESQTKPHRRHCIFFRRGRCRNGESCSFLHQHIAKKDKKPKATPTSLLSALDDKRPVEGKREAILLDCFRFLVQENFKFAL